MYSLIDRINRPMDGFIDQLIDQLIDR